MNTIYNRNKDTDYKALIKEVYNEDILKVKPVGIIDEQYFIDLYFAKRILLDNCNKLPEEVYRELSYFYFGKKETELYLAKSELVSNYTSLFNVLNTYTRDSDDRTDEMLLYYFITEEDHYIIKHYIEKYIYIGEEDRDLDINQYKELELEITNDIKEFTKTVVEYRQPNQGIKDRLRELGYLE